VPLVPALPTVVVVVPVAAAVVSVVLVVGVVVVSVLVVVEVVGSVVVGSVVVVVAVVVAVVVVGLVAVGSVVAAGSVEVGAWPVADGLLGLVPGFVAGWPEVAVPVGSVGSVGAVPPLGGDGEADAGAGELADGSPGGWVTPVPEVPVAPEPEAGGPVGFPDGGGLAGGMLCTGDAGDDAGATTDPRVTACGCDAAAAGATGPWTGDGFDRA